MEKKIFGKDSEIFELRLKLREKSDEITHLKTREMLTDTLEKGQIMDIIYYIWFEYLILLSLELGFSKDETQAYKKVSIATRQGNLYNMKITVQEVCSIQAYNMSVASYIGSYLKLRAPKWEGAL